jgi:hypothetical protein
MENEQQVPIEPAPQNTQQAPYGVQQPTNFVVGSNTAPKGKKTGLIVAAVAACVVLLLAGGAFAYVSMNQKDVDTQGKASDTSGTMQQKKNDTVDVSGESPEPQIQAVMSSSSARMIQNAAGSFYAGGSSGEVQQAENSYYPSDADMISKEWVKKNLNLPDSAITSLQDQSVVYKSEGCDSAKPSSKTNACKGFTITFKGSSGKTESLKPQF